MIVTMTIVKDVDIDIQLPKELIIKYPEITLSYWKSLQVFNNDKDITNILDEILDKLDCSFLYSGVQLLTTKHMMYDYDMSRYYYYLIRITNQFIYNDYVNKLLDKHVDNLIFEHNNPIVDKKVKDKVKTIRVKKRKGVFVKQITTDMFTNEESYIYSNSITEEVIHSSNPNLLDELNGVKKRKVKEKRSRVESIPLTSMTFSFSNKKK